MSHGKEADYLDTLAEAWFVNGQFDEAIETEKKAIAVAPGEANLKQSLERYEQAKKKKS